ncbi:MAG: hypothetical protein KBA59_04450 [Anaerolineaceae bacterium]|nr:hypothetical protein [Anaerolineaceae bacterium]HNR01087.1 hypothetical protein [Anaerolineaceae bacterium]
MGRTILSATQTWVEEEKALRRFVRALRKSDQALIQELLALSRKHVAEASYASNLYPMDIYLVSMLLEMYRKVRRLEDQLERLGVDTGERLTVVDAAIPALPSLVSLVSPEGDDPAEPVEKPADGIEYVELQDGA